MSGSRDSGCNFGPVEQWPPFCGAAEATHRCGGSGRSGVNGTKLVRVIGLDLGVTSLHSAVVLDETGRVRARRRVPSTVDSLGELEQVALAGTAEATTLTVVIEPTGPMWLPIAVYFGRRGSRRPARRTGLAHPHPRRTRGNPRRHRSTHHARPGPTDHRAAVHRPARNPPPAALNKGGGTGPSPLHQAGQVTAHGRTRGGPPHKHRHRHSSRRQPTSTCLLTQLPA
jgi:hypothetical protein